MGIDPDDPGGAADIAAMGCNAGKGAQGDGVIAADAERVSPSFIVDPRFGVRPVSFYSVDMSEFAVNKLWDRGSLSARSILTNVQDFVVTLHRGLQR